MATSIPLGSAEELVQLFSYPNRPDSPELLSETIRHWVGQMLARDGFALQGATCRVRSVGGQYTLELDGPGELDRYAERLPKLLEHGKQALEVIEQLKHKAPDPPWPDWVEPPLADRIWDPQGTGQWRFFLPLGMAIVNHKSLNFFHYPPIRLLDAMRDYLDDPVPVRLIELMEANGVETVEEAWLFSTVMDGAPIAAPDDQGTIYKGDGDYRNPVHLLPIDDFHDYQRAQVELLLNTSEVDEDYTIPIVVYGSPARATFGDLYLKGKRVSTKKAIVVQDIVPGKKTPVLGAGHPYAFFAQVQETVGAGSVLPEMWNTAVRTMTNDLSVIRWQQVMAKDPTQDPDKILKKCRSHWSDPDQELQLHTLVLRQGSLYYPDPNSLQFEFKLTMAQARARAKAALD